MAMNHRLMRPRASGFNPKSISGLFAWYDASVSSSVYDASTGGSTPGDGLSVGRWEDLSGNGRHITQGTANNRPAYAIAAKNGLAVLRFDGANDNLISSAVDTPQSATIFAVCSRSSWVLTSSYRGVFGHRNFTASASGLTAFSLVGVTFSDWISGDIVSWGSGFTSTNPPRAVGPSAAGSGYRVLAVTLGPSTSRLWVNGARGSTRVETTGSITTLNASIVMGSSYSSGEYWDGDISEVIYYGAALSLSQIDAVTRYLNRKWSVY